MKYNEIKYEHNPDYSTHVLEYTYGNYTIKYRMLTGYINNTWTITYCHTNDVTCKHVYEDKPYEIQ